MIESILEHWHHAWPSEPELTSTQLLKRTAGKARNDKTIDALRSALESAIPAISARKLGRLLRSHEGAENGLLKLAARFDSHAKNYKFQVWRQATDEELDAEHAALMAEAEQREREWEAEYMQASPDKQIRMLQRKDKERKKREVEPEPKPDLRRRENKPVETPKPEPAPDPLSVFVRPGGSRSWSERPAEAAARRLSEYGLHATAIYDRTGGMFLKVRGASVYEVRRACKTVRRLEHAEVFEAPAEPKPDKAAPSQPRDYTTPRLIAKALHGYNPAADPRGMPSFQYPKDWSVYSMDGRPRTDPRWDAIERMRQNEIVSDWRDVTNAPRKPKPEDEFS